MLHIVPVASTLFTSVGSAVLAVHHYCSDLKKHSTACVHVASSYNSTQHKHGSNYVNDEQLTLQ